MKKRTHSTKLRRFYEDRTGRALPKNFDLHHIDFNPENNDILNLIALPSKIHRKYHDMIKPYYLNETFFMPDPKWQHHISTAEIDFVLNEFQKMRDVYVEYCGWYNFRNHLLGRLQYFIVLKEFNY